MSFSKHFLVKNFTGEDPLIATELWDVPLLQSRAKSFTVKSLQIPLS